MDIDMDNLPFSADMPHRFSAGSRAAIRRSPVQQCADRLHGNARIVSGSVQSSADEHGSVGT